MADAPTGNSTRLLLMLAAALVVVVVVIWMLAGAGGSDAADEDAAYEAGVEDVSGGELIVTDPEEPAVDVDLPDTAMTPVPADEAAAAGTPPPPAE